MSREYPEIGEKIKYIRCDKDGNMEEGYGVVRSIFLDPNDRPMVQVKDGQEAYNIDLYGVNPGEGARETYQKLIETVREIEAEGNALVKETVDRYNQSVSDAYSSVLGKPVKVSYE